MTTKGNSPPLDILIRTSGVKRLSEFLLWQVICICFVNYLITEEKHVRHDSRFCLDWSYHIHEHSLNVTSGDGAWAGLTGDLLSVISNIVATSMTGYKLW